MERRTFMAMLTVGLVTTPRASEAQQAAKALGLTTPQSLLGRADQVIE